MQSIRTIEVSDDSIDIIDEVSASVAYYGTARAGTATSDAFWQIQKKSVSGVVTSFKWAGGTCLFDKVWDDRASLSYS